MARVNERNMIRIAILDDYQNVALKVADWVRAIKPICASPQMRARYSALPDKLPQLIEAAYGRAATPADTDAVTSSAMGLMPAATRYETICLAMLSSLEFVAQ